MAGLVKPTALFSAALLSSALLLASAGCAPARRSTVFVDTDLATAARSARQAFERGRPELAAQYYRRAIARARAMDDPSAIANAAYNLAACLIEVGDYETSRTQLAEARAEATRAGNSVIDILLVEARVSLLQGRPEEARAAADQVLAHKPPPTPSERLQVHLLRGEIACDERDSAAAARELDLAQRGGGAFSLALRARISELKARILSERDEPALAAAEFDRTAALMRRSRGYRAMCRSLSDAGHAYDAAGQPAQAAGRYYRAARGLFGLGDTVEAIKLIDAALSAADKAQAADLQRRAASLSSEIRQAAGKQ